MNVNNIKELFKNVNNSEIVVGTIQQSIDYAKFKLHPKNRKIRPNNLERIQNSMQIKNLFNPILVNEKYEIIDGNHRFSSWKNLNLPILFIIVEGYGVTEMQTLNLNKSDWNHDDYLDLYVKEEVKDYIKFKNIKDKYELNFSDLIHIIDILSGKKIIGENKLSRIFDEGKLSVNWYDKIEDFLNELSLFDKYNFSRHTSFVRAFLKLYTEKFYDKKYIRYRIDICDNKLKGEGRKSTILEYGKFIAESLYTSKQKNIDVIYHETSEAYHMLSTKRGRKPKQTV